ncbi:MAG: F420-dependent methylenetetrahydromethanopterin dehydrogenase [Candidatus Bathyarchaeota archaeon]
MSERIVKLGVLKVGCVGSAPLIEFLLDERAERNDIETRVVGSGASMVKKRCEEAANVLVSYKPDLAIVVSPNATVPGPTAAREVLAKNNIPTIIVSDSPVKKIVKDLEAAGFGYIIPEADSMIGARREFLDPVEMALFNSDVIKVLAITGVFPLIITSIDNVIHALKRGEKPELPRLIVNKEKSIAASGLQNPYARAKATAAYEISQRVAGLTSEGCFVIQEWENYIALVAAAHEMMRVAAKLADEAREIEKGGDAVKRNPHAKDGTRLTKQRLIEKPAKPE